MEYRKKCNVCGKIFCYTDQDIKDNKVNSVSNIFLGIGQIAAALGGNVYEMAATNNIAKNTEKEIKDFDHCPNCKSADLTTLTYEQYVEEMKKANQPAVIQPVIQKSISINSNASEEALIVRIENFIEESDWETAQAYSDHVLDMNPKNGYVYYLRTLINSKCRNDEELIAKRIHITDDPNYRYIEKYADPELKDRVQNIENSIRNNIEAEKRLEEQRKDNETALRFEQKILSVNDISKLEWTIAEIKQFEIQKNRDLSALIERANNKIASLTANLRKAAEKANDDLLRAIDTDDIDLIKSAANKLQDQKKYGDYDASLQKAEKRVQQLLQAKKDEEEFKKKKTRRTITAVLATVSVIVISVLIIVKVIIPRIEENKRIEEERIRNEEMEKRAEVRIQTLHNPEVGDIVLFGEYEQDGDLTNGSEDIEWVVLAKENSRVLVISKSVLKLEQYDNIKTSAHLITWQNSILRTWLNSDFLSESFSDKEHNMIQNVNVKATGNPSYATNPGNDTEDRIFLLSITEANTYMPNEGSRECQYSWWLRTPGAGSSSFAYIDTDGSIILHGQSGRDVCGVRPAMWIDISQ